MKKVDEYKFGKADEVLGMAIINDVDTDKVAELEKSMMENGWVGMPILYMGNMLITGSHRVAALNNIEERYYDMDEKELEQYNRLFENENVCYDVTESYEAWLEKNEDARYDYFEYDNLRKYFEGTEVERWEEELIEW